MNSKQVDYRLFFAITGLVIFGMIMISSVSVYQSHRITLNMVRNGFIEETYNYFYLIRSLAHFVISSIILILFVKIPFHLYEKYSKHIIGGITLLLLLVLFIGPSWNGARGWINVPFLPFAIQPTEFLKLGLIIFLAAFFKKNIGHIGSLKNGFFPFLGIVGFFTILVGVQPDFGTILVIVPLATIMFFVAGANIKYLGAMFLLGMFLAFSIYSFGKYDKSVPESRNKLSYITDRIDNFLSDKKVAIKNKTINYQTEQALIAIGSGGMTGLGFGLSIQKYGYLPEVQGDFIFSVIVEELGFIGAFILILLYLYIGYRGYKIAYYSTDYFAKLVAVGISSWILLQAFINIGVNLNILPLTGITLPFVSYGGSSLLSLMFGLALLLNISRDVDYTKRGKSIRNASKSFDRKKFLY